MKPEETLTGKDIKEIPALLEDFSARVNDLKKYFLRTEGDSVYLLGRGSSGNATLFAKYVWEEYTGTIVNFIRPHSIFEAKKPLNFRNSAVWAYSQSGKSTDIVACLKKLLEWGARGVSVTNEDDIKENPLAQLTGNNILLSRSAELPVAATKSFILQLWVALWAAQIWSGCFSPENFTDTVEQVKKLVGQDFSAMGQKYIGILKSARIVGFVGRGTYSAVAADAALKFREMAMVQSINYSAAEFLHGPVGACTDKDFIFLLSPSESLPDDLVKVKQALYLRGTRCEILFEPKGVAPFDRLLTDIKLKILALNLSLSKGLNPDSPKGLAKVTPTI